MRDSEERKWVADCMKDGPQRAMEKRFMEEFLQSRGYSLAEMKMLPPEKAKALMIEACRYASLKLAEMESQAGFRNKIRSSS